GIVPAEALIESPSHLAQDAPPRPGGHASFLVLALNHSVSSLDLDWWQSGVGTKGNVELQRISADLKSWCETDAGVKALPLAYHVERGGLFLKDAATLAGLGVIGSNNLLVTPEYGSRVRLRAVALDRVCSGSGPGGESPCDACAGPCMRSCPQGAFEGGSFSREACMMQMHADESGAVPPDRATWGTNDGPVVKYCRACELACPVGR
ncbi:MAG: hypothetical protein ACYTFG_22785, partial [Planctomycetota bacterium]